MPRTWVLVANSSQAKIYAGKGEKGGEIAEIKHFDYPNGRLHEGDLVSDSAGSDGGSTGQGRHVLDDETTARQQEAITFAKELANHLDEDRKKDNYISLVLIAPPAFLGLLRKNLNADIMKMVFQQIDKNLINKSAKEIREYL